MNQAQPPEALEQGRTSADTQPENASCLCREILTDDPTPGARMDASSQPRGGGRFARHSLLLLVIAATAVFLYMVREFLTPVILAAVSAGLFFPMYSWLLQRTGGRRPLSAFICCATLSLGVLVPAFVVANLASREAAGLSASAGPAIRSLLEGRLDEKLSSHPLVQKLHLENVPWSQLLGQLAKGGSELLSKTLGAVSRGAFELITTLCLAFFSMYFFFRDGPEVLAKLRYLSPLAEEHQDELIRQVLSVSRATAKGTLLIALLKGTMGGLTFWAFGIPAPVLWGAVMVFLSILPIVGPWVVMYPAALILVLNGHIWEGIAVFLIAALLVGLLDNLLQPLLIRRDSGLPELLVFFSTLGGISLFGVMGFIIGPVIAALFQTALEIYGREFSQQLTQAHHPKKPAAEEPCHTS